jgi:hypothetical protein
MSASASASAAAVATSAPAYELPWCVCVGRCALSPFCAPSKPRTEWASLRAGPRVAEPDASLAASHCASLSCASLSCASPPPPSPPPPPPRARRVEKYRPTSLDDVVGNAATVERLRVIQEDGNCPHLLISVSWCVALAAPAAACGERERGREDS